MPESKRNPIILYIEDNVLSLVLVERLLETRGGVHLMSAMSGELGLRLACTHCPEVVLLDIHLPGMGGYEVMRKLREVNCLRQTRVIGISSDATIEGYDRARDAGFFHYLTKPLDVEEFNDLMDRLLDRDASDAQQ